jgi:hypothetical protein
MVRTFKLGRFLLYVRIRSLAMHYDCIDKDIQIVAFYLSLILVFSLIRFLGVLSMRPLLFLLFFTWFIFMGYDDAVISV